VILTTGPNVEGHQIIQFRVLLPVLKLESNLVSKLADLLLYAKAN